MNIVLDTNVLISAAWSPEHSSGNILTAVFARKFTVCYDYRILEEYIRVFHYKKFKFSEWEINAILNPIMKNGISVIAAPLPNVSFERDETDRKFYEVAKFCRAILISGNLQHYPKDADIVSPADFFRRYMQTHESV